MLKAVKSVATTSLKSASMAWNAALLGSSRPGRAGVDTRTTADSAQVELSPPHTPHSSTAPAEQHSILASRPVAQQSP